ncbi:MAG: HAMP domain-containing sensor histidine kinase [Peptoniphilus sp.]|nr:HAMP domain-containing sensor histidine kinase [Peptoniphilus sp.]MDY3118813.1 HAMP domain-containing sensor histidine kinase [Peptoniphilus sp.]
MVFLICILFGILAWFVVDDWRVRREFRMFSQWIDGLEEGTEEDPAFDEKERSKAQSKLATYLRTNHVRERKLAEEKEKTERLIADISHQTKTPLANLMLYNSLLQREVKSPYLSVMDEELQNLKFLIDSLMKSSRLEGDMIELQKQSVALDAMIHDVCAGLREQAKEKGIVFALDLEKATAILDERWTKEAVHNLAENAVKYAPEGSTVCVRLRSSVASYRLSVENKAIMEGEDPAKLFARFYRGKNSIGKDGLGLGLFIAREIIEKEGGSIKALFQGDTVCFQVQLPL